LFDGVAALAGLRSHSTFEGQAAMELEFAVDPATIESYPFVLRSGSPAVVDWEPAVRALLDDRNQAVPTGQIAARFHNMLVEVVVALARHCGQTRVALSGGCFQNRYLTERVIDQLIAAGFQPFWSQRVPPNDGGISLGQICLATSPLRELT
jgi:hydrogenase maturation protein HypF